MIQSCIHSLGAIVLFLKQINLPGSNKQIAFKHEYSFVSTLRHRNLSIIASKARIVSTASSSKSAFIALDVKELGSNGH